MGGNSKNGLQRAWDASVFRDVSYNIKDVFSSSDGTVDAETPASFNTITNIGSTLDAKTKTFDESTDKEKSIAKKKLGTRGLRIPLATTQSTTTSAPDIQV